MQWIHRDEQQTFENGARSFFIIIAFDPRHFGHNWLFSIENVIQLFRYQ